MIVYFSGRFRSADEARVPLTDRGLLFGDGVWISAEVMPVVGVDGRPVGAGRPGPTARALLEGFHRLAGAG